MATEAALAKFRKGGLALKAGGAHWGDYKEETNELASVFHSSGVGGGSSKKMTTRRPGPGKALTRGLLFTPHKWRENINYEVLGALVTGGGWGDRSFAVSRRACEERRNGPKRNELPGPAKGE